MDTPDSVLTPPRIMGDSARVDPVLEGAERPRGCWPSRRRRDRVRRRSGVTWRLQCRSQIRAPS